MPRTADSAAADRHAAKPLIDQLMFTRLARNLTQVDLNDHLGCARGQLNAWESGRGTPGIAWLTRWANALGYDLALVPREPEHGS